MTTESTFTKLYNTDVSKHIEKKGKYSYLSWAWAVKALREADPKARWDVGTFEGMPFIKTECGYFVVVSVTVDGLELTQIHPVLDNYNKTIDSPNAFQINTSIQRCLVKAIALHGLGLHIYQGEDLPPSDEPPKEPEPKTKEDNEAFLLCMIDEEKRVGKDTFHKTLGNFGFEKAEEILKRQDQLDVFAELREIK